MSISEDLGTPSYKQNSYYYCGAACAQMVLDAIGAGTLAQDELYDDSQNHGVAESGWYTAPDGLAWTMNDRIPGGSSVSFVLSTPKSEDSISREICWTIHEHRVAPVALVYGSDHWVVVDGYQASAEPQSAKDAGYTITRFEIINPRAGAREDLPYATWQEDYMTGVPVGYWKGAFLAVCDSDVPPRDVTARATTPHAGQRKKRGERIVDKVSAIECADGAMRSLGLYERRHWNEALVNTKPGEPILVQRLDRRDTYYYIVPMATDNGRVSVAATVDARAGHYRHSAATTEPGVPLLGEYVDPRAAVEAVIDKRFEFADQRCSVLIRNEAYVLYPLLVWRPCQESSSALQPFHMLIVGDHRVFVRIDGQVFTKLHANGRGM